MIAACHTADTYWRGDPTRDAAAASARGTYSPLALRDGDKLIVPGLPDSLSDINMNTNIDSLTLAHVRPGQRDSVINYAAAYNAPIFQEILALRSRAPASVAFRGDSTQAVVFLELLTSGEDEAAKKRGFDVNAGGYWKNQRVLGFLDTAGVTFVDAARDTTWHPSIAGIKSQLGRRSGAAFTMMVHLGHIYAQPEPQYSRLKFSRDGEALIVTVGDWYRLAFVSRGQSVRVTKIEYLMKES